MAIKSIALNCAIGIFLLVQIVVTFGAPPSFEPMAALYHAIRPVLAPISLHVPGRFFSSPVMIPTVALAEVTYPDGRTAILRYPDAAAAPPDMPYQRLARVVDGIQMQGRAGQLVATDIVRALCVQFSEATEVVLQAGLQHSPTPAEVAHGIRYDDIALVRERRVVARQKCGSVP